MGAHHLRNRKILQWSLAGISLAAGLGACSNDQKTFGDVSDNPPASGTQLEAPDRSQDADKLSPQGAPAGPAEEATHPEDSVIAPQNVAGAWLHQCATITQDQDEAIGHVVCSSREGKILQALVLDPNNDLLRDDFREFMLAPLGQIVATSLPGKAFQQGAVIRLGIESSDGMELRTYSLSNLPEYPVSAERQAIEALLADSLNQTAVFLNPPLNPECEGTLTAAELSFEVVKTDHGTCAWDVTAGDLPKASVGLRSTRESPQGGILSTGSGKTVCEARLRVPSQPLAYSDEFVLTLENRIVAASFGKGWTFDHMHSGFPLYQKAELIGLDVATSESRCFEEPAAKVCEIPIESPGAGKLTLDLKVPVGKLRLAPKTLDWGFVVFGNNDGDGASPHSVDGTEIDCRHFGFKANVTVWEAE